MSASSFFNLLITLEHSVHPLVQDGVVGGLDPLPPLQSLASGLDFCGRFLFNHFGVTMSTPSKTV